MKNSIQRSLEGFTVVELIVVIVVIGILATLASIGLNGYLAEARDSERATNIATIAEGLEKYFDKTGEYPLCNNLQGNVEGIQSSALAIDGAAFITPSSTDTVTSSIVCTPLATTPGDLYAYVGVGCESGSSCASWQLQYREEYTDEVKTVNSRRVASSVEPVVVTPPVIPPSPSQQFTVLEVEAICDKDDPPPAGWTVINGAGGGATTTGTSGNDLIFGGSGVNIIYGLGGDDILCGNTGTDTVYGGDGTDYLVGGSGLDKLYGGDGDDLLSGQSAADELYGENGNDTIYGGTGVDTLDGGPGTDRGNDSGGTFISIEIVF